MPLSLVPDTESKNRPWIDFVVVTVAGDCWVGLTSIQRLVQDPLGNLFLLEY